MRVLIVGGAGMLGSKLAAKLASDGVLGARAIDSITLVDVVEPVIPPGAASPEAIVCDVADPGAASRLLTDRPDVIFDLAAVVSGEAEIDFEKGYRVNL